MWKRFLCVLVPVENCHYPEKKNESHSTGILISKNLHKGFHLQNKQIGLKIVTQIEFARARSDWAKTFILALK